MANTDIRIDAYIDKSAEFAKPILSHIRQIVHEACPEVEETLKWNFPNFVYKGSILCFMASFKQHCAFGFWLASKMNDPDSILQLGDGKIAMGQFGKLQTVKDLPNKKLLIKYIKEAMRLIDAGVKLSKS